MKKLNENIVHIKFNELDYKNKNNDFYKFRIWNFTNPETYTYKQTEYYLFNAECIYDCDNLRLNKDTRIKLHITSNSFINEIIRHIKINELNKDKYYDLELAIKRINKYTVHFKDVRINEMILTK